MTCSYCEAYSEAGTALTPLTSANAPTVERSGTVTGLTPLTAAHAPVNIIRVTDIICDNGNDFLRGLLFAAMPYPSSLLHSTIPHKLAMMERGAWISSGVDRRCQCN